MEELIKLTAAYVAALKAASIIHQLNHWTCKGDSFYGDHLLFERIYDSASDDIDKAAEKFIGLFGDECVDYKLQTTLLNSLLDKYKDEEPLQKSLNIEQNICDFTVQLYSCLEKCKKLTTGLDDTLSSICSNRETSIYLLKQRIKK
jgi:DNA-binding ferritin-like protein